MSHDTPELDGRIEALLFSSEIPLPARRLADLAAAAKGEILSAIDRLNVFYGESGRAFRIAEIAGGYQMVTVPAFAEVLAQLHKEKIPTRLSRAALETLAIIAFKQPVTRAEIDRIRGVSASDGVLRHLIERKTVRIAGRADAPGRPLLYGTTSEFLAYFGLANVADLPRTEELEAMLAGETPAPEDPGDLFESLGEEMPEGFAAEVPAEPEPEDGPEAAADVVEGSDDADDADDDDADDAPDDESDLVEDAEREQDDDDGDDPAPSDGDESHSGEESDDREGVVAT
ncbi:MAG TPA: SMC-Scp complex subunit ScpB [bacterium]|nr:SMC-Scp complex subunit ScpB [bacterium]